MTVVQMRSPEPRPVVGRDHPDLSAYRLLVTGTVTPAQRRLSGRTNRLIAAFAVGGALGLSYHILAPALVAGLKVVLSWWSAP